MSAAASPEILIVDGKSRNFLTESEISRMLKAARSGRHGERDYLLVSSPTDMAIGSQNS
jgi:hypothetical protein